MKIASEKRLLALVYVAIIAIVSFRIAVHPTHYTTPDSEHYLNRCNAIRSVMSQSITLSRLSKIKKGFYTWPVGYPVSIALVSFCTKTSPLVSSKIVNFIFLGLLFILLYNWHGKKAWFLALSFFSYGSLEVISETWSETPFIFFVFLLAYTITKSENYSPFRSSITLTICLIFLFLFRYVGVIYIFIVALYGLKYFLNGVRKLSYSYFAAIVASSIFSLWYLYDNKLSSGYLTGTQRIHLGYQTFFEFTKLLFQALFNEINVARNYNFNNENLDFLFVSSIIIQSFTIFLLVKKRSYLNRPLKLNSGAKALLNISVGYLVGIVLLKIIIPFDNFDFRILFPFTSPLFIMALAVISNSSQREYFKKTYRIIVLFMLISFMWNLPKKYILNKIKHVQLTMNQAF